MENSKFQLNQFRITEIKYQINEDYKFQGDIPLEIKANNKVIKSQDQNNEAIVVLTLNLYEESKKDTPFYFIATIQGKFSWNKDISENITLIDSLLASNAPAILLSYIRPFITQITSFSGFPPLIIPLLNFQESKKPN